MANRPIKRLPNPTKKSISGEMKVNKVFGTDKKLPATQYSRITKTPIKGRAITNKNATKRY